MKRSADAISTSTTNRRALLLHHDPALLADKRVVAFLDNKVTTWNGAALLMRKFAAANEPQLLIELVHASGCTFVEIATSVCIGAEVSTLPPGFLEHVLPQLSKMPHIERLDIGGADLSAQSCALLQTALNEPGCNVVELNFFNCLLVGPAARFPDVAPKVRDFTWVSNRSVPDDSTEVIQILPRLAGWTSLSNVRLKSEKVAMDFAALAHLLEVNHHITSLELSSRFFPLPGVHLALPPFDPVPLLDAIKNNRTALAYLSLSLTSPIEPRFDERLMRLVADCLSINTTLVGLRVPGVAIQNDQAQQWFFQQLWQNTTLLELEPHEVFGDWGPPPIERNNVWCFQFSPEFVLGAAQAFMEAIQLPAELGKEVAPHLTASTVDCRYSRAFVAMVNKSTYAGAQRARSRCLREALITFLAAGDESGCEDLIVRMAHANFGFLPDDKAAVVEAAKRLNRMKLLPIDF